MKWFAKLFDSNFILQNWKTILIILVGLLLGCSILFFTLISNQENAKEQTEIANQEKEEAKEQEKLEQQQAILKENLTETFTLGKLTYSAPAIDSDNAFLNTSDYMLGSYKDYILFSTVNEGLYFYNINNGDTRFVTDQSILNSLAGDKLFYVEILSGLEKEVISYDIKANKKETLMGLTYKELVTEIAGSSERLYYIIRDNGVNHLQSLPHTIDITSNQAILNMVVPNNSFLVQDEDKPYLINSEGYFFLDGTKVTKLGTVPQITITSAKMYQGTPLIYGYNSATGNSELYYGNKLIATSDFIFDYVPIEENYVLINDNNELYILEVDTLATKTIAKLAADFVVLDGGDIVFRTSLHSHGGDEDEEEHKNPYFYLERRS